MLPNLIYEGKLCILSRVTLENEELHEDICIAQRKQLHHNRMNLDRTAFLWMGFLWCTVIEEIYALVYSTFKLMNFLLGVITDVGSEISALSAQVCNAAST